MNFYALLMMLGWATTQRGMPTPRSSTGSKRFYFRQCPRIPFASPPTLTFASFSGVNQMFFLIKSQGIDEIVGNPQTKRKMEKKHIITLRICGIANVHCFTLHHGGDDEGKKNCQCSRMRRQKKHTSHGRTNSSIQHFLIMIRKL
jgi:hypothetical protein